MKLRLSKACLCVWTLGAAPAFAQFITFATPTPAYTSGTTVMSIPGADFSTTSTLTDGTETLTFSSAVSARTVPGGGWATWNSPPAVESHTPRVLFANAATTLTITLSPPQAVFGFELEPNGPGTFAMTTTFLNGATTLGSIPLNIPANSGALVSAASSSTPITSVVITAPAGANGFALAQIRRSGSPIGISSVPTAGMPALGGLALALLAGGSLLARRQNLDNA